MATYHVKPKRTNVSPEQGANYTTETQGVLVTFIIIVHVIVGSEWEDVVVVVVAIFQYSKLSYQLVNLRSIEVCAFDYIHNQYWFHLEFIIRSVNYLMKCYYDITLVVSCSSCTLTRWSHFNVILM